VLILFLLLSFFFYFLLIRFNYAFVLTDIFLAREDVKKRVEVNNKSFELLVE
jgi:hypothetical protein